MSDTKTVDAAAPLVQQLEDTQESLVSAFSKPEFYIELLCIGLSLALAFLVAKLIRRRTEHYLFIHPPKRIDAEFITKPLSLLGGVFAVLYLSVARPIVQTYAKAAPYWLDAVVQLCLAFLATKLVFMVVGKRAISYFIGVVIMIIAVLNATGFMPSTTEYLSSMAFQVGSFKISLLNLIHGLVILVIVFWIAGLLSRTLESYLRRSSGLSYNARELTVKFFRIFIYFIALLITLSAVGVDLTAFAVFGGALGVGIGLGLQKITSNFVSGITLLVEKSIKLGDLIEVGQDMGVVRALNIRYALIETPDGRELLIPNEELITTKVTNWTHSNEHARIEIKANIAYDSDVRKARQIMLDIASKHPRCLRDPEPLCHLREFGESALVMVLMFWIPDVKEGRLGPQHDVMLGVLEAFRTEGIHMPYPQRVVHMLGEEPAKES